MSPADSDDSGSEYAPECDDGDEPLSLDEEECLDQDDMACSDDERLLDDDEDNDDIDSDELDLKELEEQVARLEDGPPSGSLDEHDADALFDGNLRPVEWYRNGIKSLKLDDYVRKEYSQGTDNLIAHAENQWRLYVAT